MLVLLLGDQPGVTAETVAALVAGRGDAPLAACALRGRPRPPARLRARRLPWLRRCTATAVCGSSSTAGRARRRRRPGPGTVPRDVDTWEDYDDAIGARPPLNVPRRARLRRLCAEQRVTAASTVAASSWRSAPRRRPRTGGGGLDFWVLADTASRLTDVAWTARLSTSRTPRTRNLVGETARRQAARRDRRRCRGGRGRTAVAFTGRRTAGPPRDLLGHTPGDAMTRIARRGQAARCDGARRHRRRRVADGALGLRHGRQFGYDARRRHGTLRRGPERAEPLRDRCERDA